MPTERITFPGHAGDLLAARLELPDGPPIATALFAHCFTCSKDIAAARRIAARLAAMGIAVLRFDFTGLGHSGGEFANTSFTSNVEDLVAACAYLSGRDLAPSLLIGHSLGGAAVLKAAPQLPGVRAVATLNAPFDPAHVTRHFADALARIKAEGAAEVDLGGRPFRIGRSFVEDISAASLGDALGKLRAALLVLHAPRDEIVGIDNATQIFRAARHPKSFVSLDDADHLISKPEDAEYAAEIIAAWVRRYVDFAEAAPGSDVPEGVVTVSETDPGSFLQDVQSGAVHIHADEPAAYGGSGKGLSPYGLLAAGLGACTSMTIRMYARRKGWPLEHVQVSISHAKVHAKDAETEAPRKIDRFERVIRLTGDLDAAQRQKLIEIGDKCPVHRTIEHGAEVVTTLEKTPGDR
ncbi:MAG: OsmC family protein [Sedimentitalea sp.]|nr:OsmC family protein [Sedimentitalea sp.]